MADLSTFADTLTGLVGANPNFGMNYQPNYANVSEPVATNQTDLAYNNSNSGLSQQQAFVNALMSQNGIGNQNFVGDQLRQQALGQGPNPAMQALANSTGQNVANQAALMAGQRGAGANAGLIARQAGMQGGNIQQQAVGQGALMQAQQQLAAQQALQSLGAQQVSQQQGGLNAFNQGAQSLQQMLLNSIAEANKQKVAMQGNINSVGGNLAVQNAKGEQNTLQGFGQGLGAIAGQIPWGKIASSMFSGGGGGASSGDVGNANGQNQSDGYYGAKGGMVPQHYDGGGIVDNSMVNNSALGPRSFVGRYLSGWSGSNIGSADDNTTAAAPQAEVHQLDGNQKSGTSDALGNTGSWLNSQFQGFLNAEGINGGPQMQNGILQPGNITYDKGDEQKGGGTGPVGGGTDGGGGLSFAFARGGPAGQVPGKASVKGDSLKNDTVKAMLSPGEIVIPRHISMGPNAPERARDFVAAVLAKNGMMGKRK